MQQKVEVNSDGSFSDNRYRPISTLVLVFLDTTGQPVPPNFGPPLKIHRKKCGRRKRRQILESWSAAEKIQLNSAE